MIEKQINFVINPVHSEAHLPIQKSEVRAKFLQKLLNLVQDGVFKIIFGIGVFQSQKIQNITAFENQIGCQFAGLMDFLQFCSNEIFRLLRKCRPLIECALNLFRQFPGTPALNGTHF